MKELTLILMFLSMFAVIVAFTVNIVKKRVQTPWLKYMLISLLIGMLSSCFPFLTWGLMFGLPSVILNTFLMAIIFRKELTSESSANR